MEESTEFAGELFDALARRRGIALNSITKVELRDFWEQMTDQSFDARLQTFFDMVDKNADGRITEEEVKEVRGAKLTNNGQINKQPLQIKKLIRSARICTDYADHCDECFGK